MSQPATQPQHPRRHKRRRALSRRPRVCPHARPSRARNGQQVWGQAITRWQAHVLQASIPSYPTTPPPSTPLSVHTSVCSRQAHVPKASIPSYPTKPLNPVLCPPALPPSTPLVCPHLCLHPPCLCAPIHPALIKDASAAFATHGSPRHSLFLPRDASTAAASHGPPRCPLFLLGVHPLLLPHTALLDTPSSSLGMHPLLPLLLPHPRRVDGDGLPAQGPREARPELIRGG